MSQDCVRFDKLPCVQKDRDSARGALFGVIHGGPASVRLIQDDSSDIECRHSQNWARTVLPSLYHTRDR